MPYRGKFQSVSNAPSGISGSNNFRAPTFVPLLLGILPSSFAYFSGSLPDQRACSGRMLHTFAPESLVRHLTRSRSGAGWPVGAKSSTPCAGLAGRKDGNQYDSDL